MELKNGRITNSICMTICAVLGLVLLSTCLLTGKMTAAASGSFETDENAGKISVDPTGSSEGYSAVMYDNSNGLPTSEANAIVETKEGFIWIGSYGGLIRYDGNDFERMDSSTGIASVVSLYVDFSNRLWIGTNDSGAFVMKDDEMQSYNKADGLPSLSVRSIVEDLDGNIYLATTQGIAIVDKQGSLEQIDDEHIKDAFVRELRVGEDGIIYGVTKNGALFTIDHMKLSGYYDSEDLKVSDVRTVMPDPKQSGYVYLGTMNSDIYYVRISEDYCELEKTLDTDSLNSINCIELVDDYLWVCADTGIGFIDGEKITVLNNVPMNTSVEKIMVDYLGDIWFVSSQLGVMKIVSNQFADIYEQYHLEDEVVYTTCIFDGKLFVGTKNNGLLVLGNEKQVDSIPIESDKDNYDNLIEMLSECRIRSIYRDSRERLWFSTFSEQGLVRYDHGKVTHFLPEDGLPSDRVRIVYEREDGSYMVCCTGGVAIIEDDIITEVYTDKEGIENTEVLTASQMDNGDMVVGTDGGGIYIISGDITTHIGTDEGLSSDIVMRLKKDISRDIMWIVTSNAIGYLDSEYNVHMIKNFPYSNNFDLYENSNDNMWVISSNGIYVAEVEQLIENQEVTLLYYGMDNGLPCIATSNSYSELTDDGDLYIAGITGIAKVNIESSFENVENFKMAVPYVGTENGRIYPNEDGDFIIPSDTDRLTIYSYVYNYSLMNPKVSYHLDGLENDDTTVLRSELVPVTYTNLRGKNYRFIMKIRDPQGESSKELTVNIIKQKALYEMLWVKILIAFALIGLIALMVWAYIRYRTKRFEKKEKEQKQLIHEIVEAFAKVIDMKDAYTNGHSSRVAEYTAMLAKELGYDDDTVEKYYNIAMLHDIGKVAVPPEVLNKPGKLTDEEFSVIKSHTTLGFETLKGISIMPELATGAGAHHERPDGKGYPNGLKGDEIPRAAQIIAVADTFDAMYSNRPYRKRMNFEKVVSIITEVRGTQLTADVVDAFLRLVEKGKFRAPDDNGGGSMEDINNIRKGFESEGSI